MLEISIVVIIYKIEKYLPECIESILKQTFKNFELILVDDGSPDKCPQICDYYAGKDSRIKVLHQENQGAVMARWNGLLASNGKYISILDGDDWIEPDMYQQMIDMIKDNDSDIAIVGYNEQHGENFIPKGNVIKSGLYKGEKLEQLWRSALYTGKYYEPGIIPAFWNKLFKRELFFNNLSPANPLLKMGEDAAITYPLIARANSIAIDNEIHVYNYRVIEGSMSRSYDSMYFERVELLLKGLKENLDSNAFLLEGLPYYGLFLLQIGLYQQFSRANTDSLFKKIIELNNVMKKISKVLCFENIKWEGFKEHDRKLMKPFTMQKTSMLVTRIYVEKILRKIKYYG